MSITVSDKQIPKRSRSSLTPGLPAAVLQEATSAVRALGPALLDHSRRVSVLSECIASEMHMDATQRERLRIAAFLHDVGKCRISRAILEKPGPLDVQEFDLMRQHSQFGAE